MKNLKESISIKIYKMDPRVLDSIFFYIKNNSKSEAHDYFCSKNLIETYCGFFRDGFYFNLNRILNLKEFKIEISEVR